MQLLNAILLGCAGRRSQRSTVPILVLGWMFLLTLTAGAQLSGTYSVGGGAANYSTIDNAIAALNQNGVNGAVTFLINGGTYTPPIGGYTLGQVNGMSATNTVTFRPASGATVTIEVTTSNGTAVFTIDGGDFYIIDGSNSAGGTSRDMTIRQTSTTYSAAVWIRNDADYNIVRNAVIQSTNGTLGVSLPDGGVTVFVGQSNTTSGNDSNTIQNNVVGDPNNNYRGYRAIYVYGASTTYPNIGTKVLDNDVVNFGVNGNQPNCFGIFISYHNTGAIVRGNTVRMTTASGTSFSQAYGLYVNEQYVSPSGNSVNTILDRNRVYGLQTSLTSGELVYDLAYFGDLNTVGSNVKITNNMFSIDRSSSSSTYYGMYVSATVSSSTISIYNNSLYVNGSGSGSTMYMLFAGTGSSPAPTFNHKNNVYYANWSGGGYGVYISSATGWTSDYTLMTIAPSSTSAYIGYYNGAQRGLSDFQTASGGDANSITGNPQFISPSTGDLHINTQAITPVESAGTPLASVPVDYDNQTRNATTPDLGADEGNFNGGGVRVISPNGGELVLSESPMTIQYSTTRVLPVTIQLSLDHGVTWSTLTTVAQTGVGTNTYTFTAPDTVTARARVRVFNTGNPIEADTSDASFSFVRPTVHITSPNGGERIYEGETMKVRWISIDMPANKRVKLEYSLDGGTSWYLIATDLASTNLPDTNSYDWIVPAARTERALVRVSMTDKPVSDQSDGFFTILKRMNLLAPVGGETLYVGDTFPIRWAVVNTNYLSIEYSLDAGVNWIEIVHSIPGYSDSLLWRVPNTPTTQGLVRIINRDQRNLVDESPSVFTIVRPELELLAPNGGEKYELGEPVTVQWSSDNVTTLRLEYSSNNGANWQVVDGAVPAENGSYTFTPPEIPTKHAYVRLTDVDRNRIQDISDSHFEILQPKSIQVFAPGEGDQLLRGSTTWIYWRANRINSITIQYSSNGGSSWTTVVSNVPAAIGGYQWNVPNQLTDNGVIRILEIGGPIIGLSGRFSIVDLAPSSIRIVMPNGGESYVEGDVIPIRWNPSPDLVNARLEYSSDGGSAWTTIIASTPAGAGTYNWIAPNLPGTNYVVRVTSGSVSDVSDAPFEIIQRLQPVIRVIRPNGGEDFLVGASEQIAWNETDITAPQVTLSYSTNNGANWTQIAQVATGTLSYDWNVPDEVTTEALVRVTVGSIGDTSDAVFSISKPIVKTLNLTSPDGGEIWTEGEVHQVTWTSTGFDAGDMVRLQYSTDAGVSWSDIVASTSGLSGSYDWTIPKDTTATALARVTLVGDPSVDDKSQLTFTIQAKVVTGGVAEDVRGGSLLHIVGNYPNPFADRTRVTWEQARAGDVLLRLYDGSGRLVAEYDGGRRGAGEQEMEIRAGDLSSGLYHFELRTGNGVARGLMMIAR